MAELDAEIQKLQEVINQTSQDHPDCAGTLFDLAVKIYNRFQQTDDTADLDQAIEHFQTSVEHTQPDQLALVGWRRLECLALGFRHRHQIKGNTVDLDASIKYFRAAVDPTPIDHQDRPGICFNLAVECRKRYQQKGDIIDLDTAIKYFQESVDQTSSGPIESIGRHLFGLAVAFRDRYQRTDNLIDLDAAIKNSQASLDQTPPGDPNRGAPLRILAVGYSDRYRRTGNVADLNKSIENFQASIEQTATDDPGRAGRIHSFIVGYSDRYRLTGNTADLDTVIEYIQALVDITQPGDPAYAQRLHDLGVGYYDRYHRTETETSIESAIKYIQASVDQTPQSHPEHAGRLYSLAVVHRDRYRLTRNTIDLDTAIKYFQASVILTPRDHPNRGKKFRGLGLGYHDQYDRTKNMDDLVMAIKCFQISIDQISPDDPDYAGPLYDLATGYLVRYNQAGNIADLNIAAHRFREVTNATACNVQLRLQAAMTLLPIYAEFNIFDEAYNVGRQATQLIPLLAPRFLQGVDKQHKLAEIVGLASDSAAIAFWAEKEAFDALQLLELGRGIISGSLTEMRTDITALSNSHPELGREFISLRDVLDSPEAPLPDGFSYPSNNRSNLRYDAQNRMERLLSDIRNRDGFEDFLRAPKREDMQKAAASGAIVVINVSLYHCRAILIEQHIIRSIPLPELSIKDIEKKAKAGDFGSYQTLCWMWDTIAEPVLQALGLVHPLSGAKCPHIWWISTRLLTKFPLHAAGRHREKCSATVLDRVMSSYASSVKAIIHHRSIGYSAVSGSVPSQALLVAVPNALESSPLRWAIKEVEMVREACESMTITPVESGCRKPDIISNLAKCKIFHFAGHGSTNANDPSRSFLLLEDWKTDPLTVAHLLDINVHSHLPFLAYLSACGTGQIRTDNLLDESIHLISAFQLAGFRHVIGTLWDVQDELCVDVARITYQGIKDGCMTDESVCLGLHNASRKLRDEWVSAVGSQSRSKAGDRDANHRNHGQVRPERDAELSQDEEDEVSLSWVPYVHYGV